MAEEQQVLFFDRHNSISSSEKLYPQGLNHLAQALYGDAQVRCSSSTRVDLSSASNQAGLEAASVLIFAFFPH